MVSPVLRSTRSVKAPEDWRTPRPGGRSSGLVPREASWLSAVPDFHPLQFPAVGPRIPKGFRQSAQGCESASYPGSGSRIRTTMKGLRHGARPRWETDATPLGLRIILPPTPRVGAGRTNPGLNDAIPLGLSGIHGGPNCREASWTGAALYRFCPERAEAPDKDSRVVHFTRAGKAPEGPSRTGPWRTPSPGGRSSALDHREAAWTAVALYRFCPIRIGAPDTDSPVVQPTRSDKAPEDWRTPSPGGRSMRPCLIYLT
jgi:hypothetical protein